ncbi:MAG: DUF1573 domain-containing protein [Phycisphaerae bacterium]|nr:DUF1573 domain-containing protein [Phycisphaerae bacterium]NIR67404.1 DUF1573 domain-containing protein [candidate division Zixibacteria bacterium]NIP53519.1 DUF1573 domain-containing protein [Phycisphaerae bacterium]NIS52477.1 DUF1573 domain-containing protein [Phycisphaerae bacterium]NIU09996.1 DUF1573 domain-containing protein [Phycisphaerae bacterium]
MIRSRFQKIEIAFVIGCILLLQICCQEQLEGTKASKPVLTDTKPALSEPEAQKTTSTTAPVPGQEEPAKTKVIKYQTKPEANEPGPEITFESLIYDYGEIGAGTRNSCEFSFKNTGATLLKISNVNAPCGCTVPKLDKKEFAPGEGGTLTVIYRPGNTSGSATKRLYVNSNDKAKPRLGLTIKAKVVMKVEHSPERLNLLLKGENAGCPEITLKSRDNVAFAIKGFKSTGNSITADFDPSVKAASFNLKPKTDIEKLRKALRGQIDIDVTHPECKKVTIIFDTLAEFKIDPRVVYVREAQPKQPVTKKVRVFSNYNEDVEIESTSSRNGTIKVLGKEKIRNGYQFEIQITPPDAEAKRRVFTDVFYVKLKDAEQMQITCYGIYSKKTTKSPT